MIPKVIHYCWFGLREKPKLAKKCIASWKKYCPDYEIVEWNGDNFDISANGYTQKCYNEKSFAFLSDYVRLMVIAEQGGIYFDTDVELIRPIDGLLTNPAFFGFEDSEHVNTGLGFGAEPGNPAVQAMLREYDVLFQGDIPAIGCPILNTAALVKMGLCLNGEKQDLGVAIVYPADFFNPYDDPTGRLSKTNNTISIHWYSKSWMSKFSILRSKLTKPLHRLLGKDFFRKRKRNCQ